MYLYDLLYYDYPHFYGDIVNSLKVSVFVRSATEISGTSRYIIGRGYTDNESGVGFAAEPKHKDLKNHDSGNILIIISYFNLYQKILIKSIRL